MKNTTIKKMSGHWVLAKAGKKVLRPGGKELTSKMINFLEINSKDKVVEFAPGLGYTANIVLNKKPKNYVGFDLEDDIIQKLTDKYGTEAAQFKIANAASTMLEDNSKTKVFGEAMLTMQADHRKREIIQEAFPILEVGGLYAIHELALKPNNISDEIKKNIQRELAETMNVNARPLTIEEWKKILEEQNFDIIHYQVTAMHLLEPARIIDDEGFTGFVRIVKNILSNSDIRKRILRMKNIFKKYENNLCAVILVAKKR